MERYRLTELTTLTGLTPRTIRFYIAEGLLPPPEGAGPTAVYTAGHRDRLRLIGRLKDLYLPLREIRQRLAALDDQQVRKELASLDNAGPAHTEGADTSGHGGAEPGAALDGARRRTPGALPTYAAPSTPPSPLPASPFMPTPAREQWERIALADGVELHVRADRRREGTVIDAIERQARTLLGGS